MGWLEGLVSGYGTRRREIEIEETRKAEASAAREGKVFEMLLNSPDEELRGMAATGLLANTQPGKRKKGLQGWFGEVESNPIYPTIMKYLQTPKVQGYGPPTVTQQLPAAYTAVPTAVPNQNISGQVTDRPDAGAPAALPATSPTEPGTPPQTPVEPTPPPAPPKPLQPMVPDTPPTMQAEPPPMLQAPPTPRAFGTPGGLGLAPYQETQPLPENYVQREVGAPPPLPGRAMSFPPGPTTIERGAPIMGLPHAFPSIEDIQTMTAQGQAVGDVRGTIAGYTEMFRKADPSLTEEEAAAKAAELFALERQRLTGTSATAGGMYVVNAAREMGYRTPDEAFMRGGPQVYAKLLDRAEQLRLEATYAGTTGSGLARYNNPIDVSTAARTGARVGSSSADYGGQRVPTALERTRRNSAVTIKSQLERIKGLLGVLPQRGDTLSGTFPGWDAWFKQRSPWHREQVATLGSAVNNIQALLTRTIQGNVGTQTEQDATRTLQTLLDFDGKPWDPLKGDTQESATARLAETINFLDGVIGEIPELIEPNAGGPPVPPGAEPAPEETPPPTGFWTSPSGDTYYNGQPI